MKTNMGILDRSVRAGIAIIIVALYLTEQISSTAAVILLTLAAIFIATSFLSFCPLYLPFGFNTKKKP
jgi:hypothetical protein